MWMDQSMSMEKAKRPPRRPSWGLRQKMTMAFHAIRVKRQKVPACNARLMFGETHIFFWRYQMPDTVAVSWYSTTSYFISLTFSLLGHESVKPKNFAFLVSLTPLGSIQWVLNKYWLDKASSESCRQKMWVLRTIETEKWIGSSHPMSWFLMFGRTGGSFKSLHTLPFEICLVTLLPLLLGCVTIA